MRLTCPNCDAQYEIDASLIPDAGRDVQCSNCGKTWFEPPVGGLAETPVVEEASEPIAESQGQADTSEDRATDPASDDVDLSGLTDEAAAFFGASPVAEPVPHEDFRPSVQEPFEEDFEPEPEPEPEPALEETPEPEPEIDGPDPDEAPVPVDDLPRRELDPEVRTILREEAEREMAARRADRGEVIETQAEMGLVQTDAPAAAATSQLRGDPVPADENDDNTLRKAMLPDVEEINSTLIATADRPDGVTTAQDIEDTVKRRSGFRIGFAAMLGLAMLLIVLYLSAPALGRMIPALEPMLAGYVDWANSMRVGIDSLLERVLGAGP